jgi:glycosyltransferase involved in cell wall biosynthesis
LRILLINSEYPPIGGGAGNASFFLARALADEGQQVTILTSRFAGLPREESQKNLRLVRVPALRRRQDRSNALEQLSFIFGGFFSSLKIIRTWRPDISLAFFGMPGGAIAWALKLLFRLPYIVSLRGGDVPGFRPYDFAVYHKMIAPLLRRVWRKADAVVANSSGLQSLAHAFDSNAKIEIIPNGVQIDIAIQGERNWYPPHMLIVGRVVFQKGFDLLLAALGTLLELEWKLSIAGDGPLRPELEVMAEQLAIAKRVEFLGWQEKEQLSKHYQEANLFVYPSRHEGMPNVVLEAMASGLPVIASRIAGNEELVIHGETGILVPPDDIPALTAALKELLPDAKKRNIMGGAGYERVKSSYTWENTASQYLRLMRAIMEKR